MKVLREGLVLIVFVFIVCVVSPTALIAQLDSTPLDSELDALGLLDGTIIQVDESADSPYIELPVSLGHGESGVLELYRTSIRTRDYRVYHMGAENTPREASTAPLRTYRGVLRVNGEVRGQAAASVLPEGLYAKVILDDDSDALIVQPCGEPGLAPADSRHILFSNADAVGDGNRLCGAVGIEGALDVSHLTPQIAQAKPPLGSMVMVEVAELAIDVDYEYFLFYGSVAAVQARVEAVINLVNVQYERDVGIHLELSGIVVRDNASDPYSGSNPENLLSQLRNEWTFNQGAIPRDLIHLFTGKDLDGNVIGVAYIGAVCNTVYYLGVSQVDWTANMSGSTDLLAHEIGHNFGSNHCACPSNTMNPSITFANQFHPTLSVPTIESFRDSIACLETQSLVDETAPAVTFVTPSEGELVYNSVDILVSAADPSGLTSLEFFLDGAGTPFFTDTTSPTSVTLDTTGLADGVHSIRIDAVDASPDLNAGSTTLQFDVLQNPTDDPGFAFIDVDNDGLFSMPAADFILPTSVFSDGVFDTRKSESGYIAVNPNVGVVIPESVGPLSTDAKKGFKLISEGQWVINTPLSTTSPTASLSIQSLTTGITLGSALNVSAVAMDAPKKVKLTAKAGNLVVNQVDLSSAKIQVTAANVNCADGQIVAQSGVTLNAGSGTVTLGDFIVQTTLEKGKVILKGSGGITGTDSELRSPKVLLKTAANLSLQDCQVLACGSTTGVVSCSSASSNINGSTVIAGKKISMKRGDADLTNATIASSTTAGRIAVTGLTITVDGATLLEGNGTATSIKGTVTGTPAAQGQGTVVCP